LKHYKFPTLMFLCLLLLGMTALGASANTSAKKVSQASAAVSPGKAVTSSAAQARVVNMQNVPKETAAQAAANTQRRAMPLGTGVSPQVYAQRKAAAAHSNAVKPGTAPMKAPAKSSSTATQTPGAISQFAGMSDSAATCPFFGGCQPPDQALAVSFSQVVQGVNTSFAVYNLKGTLQPGWPKTAQSFFGIPNPGSCSPTGPFLSDPRAFYDQNFNRFWVAMLQVEGVVDTCPQSSTYWIAVSQTGNATGLWNVYHFDMTLGTANWADFTEFGFDQQAIYFSGNMFDFSTESYQYAEYFAVRKIAMMNGQAVTARGFVDPTLNAIPLDTIQPTLGEALQAGGPLGGQFIASQNINFGSGGCSSGCSGVVVFSISNPGNSGQTASATFVSTDGYSLPPAADEPGCAGCIDSGDTRINGTPAWHNGMITFSLNTAVNNGTQVVPAIFWGQIRVSLNDNGSIQSASDVQDGYLFYAGDGAAMYGATGADSDGDMFMVFAFSSGSFDPSVAYIARRVTRAPGTLSSDGGIFLEEGVAPYLGHRWGDYYALSPSGVPFTDEVWFSGEFANSSGDWSTEIGHAKFGACFSQPCSN
jgi:hypothetical protein